MYSLILFSVIIYYFIFNCCKIVFFDYNLVKRPVPSIKNLHIETPHCNSPDLSTVTFNEHFLLQGSRKPSINTINTMLQTDFVCQKCKNRLFLDESLEKLTSAQSNLLTQIISEPDKHAKESSSVNPELFIPSNRLELYKEINKSNPQPIITKNVTDNANELPSSLNSNYSYVFISDEESSPGDKVTKKKSNEVKEQPKETVSSPIDDPSSTISGRINTLNHIFQVLSTNQEIDHPLCSDCSQLLVENFKLKFDQSQREKDYYLTFLKKLKERDGIVSAKINPDEIDSKLMQAMNEYEKLQQEEQDKITELKQLEQTKKELDQQLIDLNHEFTKLKKFELNKVLELKNNLSLELRMKSNKLEQSKSLYQMHLNNLDRLRTLNIYNKFFDISFDKNDEYGTINGFRLGHKVPWSEMNAAFGQIVLLLTFLMKRLELNLANYRLVPMGSKSQIIKISYTHREESMDPNTPEPAPSSEVSNGERVKLKTVLNLYSSNEFSLGKLFNFNKLDVSMIALLDILAHIEAKLVNLDPEIELPYAISRKRDSIGGKSIRVTSNSEWSYSCKYLLTNLNWILAYTSAHTSPATI